jgi:hypothetical protein
MPGDSVEIQRSVAGKLEPAGARRGGIGEGAALVSEQLRFDEGFRKSGTVHGDERLAPTRAGIVEKAREGVLTDACFSRDEDGSVHDGIPACLAQQRTHGAAPREHTFHGRRSRHTRAVDSLPRRVGLSEFMTLRVPP